MGSPILIMGEVWGSNLSERGCPIAQKAHYQVPQHFSQCLRALFHAFCAFPILLKRYRDLRRAVYRLYLYLVFIIGTSEFFSWYLISSSPSLALNLVAPLPVEE